MMIDIDAIRNRLDNIDATKARLIVTEGEYENAKAQHAEALEKFHALVGNISDSQLEDEPSDPLDIRRGPGDAIMALLNFFAERGPNAVSIAIICRGVNLSRGAFHSAMVRVVADGWLVRSKQGHYRQNRGKFTYDEVDAYVQQVRRTKRKSGELRSKVLMYIKDVGEDLFDATTISGIFEEPTTAINSILCRLNKADVITRICNGSYRYNKNGGES